MIRHLSLRLFLLAPVMLLGACATTPFLGIDQPPPFRATYDPTVVATREKLVEGARSILGKRQLVVRGRRFNMDCTGVVLAIYWYAGIDLAREFNRLQGNGVSRIYQTLERQNLLYSTTTPLPGDIVFWDNTYDENQNPLMDDPLSHVGMVVETADDGTISYVHYHITHGITIDHMNLRNPDVQSRTDFGVVRIINSPLRLAVRGQPHAAKWLSGQLYRALGMGYLLE